MTLFLTLLQINPLLEITLQSDEKLTEKDRENEKLQNENAARDAELKKLKEENEMFLKNVENMQKVHEKKMEEFKAAFRKENDARMETLIKHMENERKEVRTIYISE